MSFIRRRELDCFDTRQVTCSCPIGNAFELEGITILVISANFSSFEPDVSPFSRN